jgi:membrane protease YdiL (CAAX protease family)
MNPIFMGDHGLRAGWRLLIFLAIFILLAVGGSRLAGAFSQPIDVHAVPPGPAILREGLLLAALFAAMWIMARIEKRSVFSYGFKSNYRLSRLASGIAVGFIAVSALVGLVWLNGLLVFDGRLLHGAAMWKYAALWGTMFLIVAFFEEGLLRGYLQYTLARGLGFWWAAIILSILFGAVHANNREESPVGVLTAAAAGLVFCLSLWLTRSLWWAVGVHAGWGWAEGYFYGVANSGVQTQGHLFATHPVGNVICSGGPTGPEGSVYALLVLLVMAAGIRLVWGRSRSEDLRWDQTSI